MTYQIGVYLNSIIILHKLHCKLNDSYTITNLNTQRCTGMYPHMVAMAYVAIYVAIVLANLVTLPNLAVATTWSLMLIFLLFKIL